MALHWTGRWCVSLPSRTLHPKDIAGRRGPFQRGLICRGPSGRIGVGRSTCWQPRAARGWLCHLCHLCCLCYLGTRAAKAWTAAPHLSVANLWGSMWSANRNKLQNTLSRRRRNSSLQHSWRGTLSDDSGAATWATATWATSCPKGAWGLGLISASNAPVLAALATAMQTSACALATSLARWAVSAVHRTLGELLRARTALASGGPGDWRTGLGGEKMMPWGAPWAARRTCAVVITKMLEIAAAWTQATSSQCQYWGVTGYRCSQFK